MTVLCVPAVAFPEFVVTQDETQELGRRLYAGHPQLEQILRMIRNTGVLKRHLIRPLEQCLEDTGFTHRNQIFEQQAKQRLPPVVDEALGNAELRARDIGLVVFVSCTGFTMPSLTAWVINSQGMEGSTAQLPISQLGCAGGVAALNRAADFCDVTGKNALVVTVEFCSLCYQPTDGQVGSLISNGLFGDALAAAVLRGDGRGRGVRLTDRACHLIPSTESWISYEVRSTGFHFRLDKRVAEATRLFVPAIADFVARQNASLAGLEHYAVHAGGPRILDSLHMHGGVDPEALTMSRQGLERHGNIASVSVLDVLSRMAEAGPAAGDRMLMAGFGPGVTMELAYGTWSEPPADPAATGR